jgi:hypothetical protein
VRLEFKILVNRPNQDVIRGLNRFVLLPIEASTDVRGGATSQTEAQDILTALRHFEMEGGQ